MVRSGAEKKLSSLSVLKTVLNSIDALLYVSDIKTDEVLFLNKRIREHFNLNEQAVGKICWKVFQTGLEQRCDYCPFNRLSEDFTEPVVWEARNSKTDRIYRNTSRIIEWPDGKKVHLLHSIDITDIRLTEQSLEKRLRQQELMSAVSQSFTTARDTKQLIYEALKMSGEFMGVNQAFLSKYQQEEGVLECLYEWYDEKGQPYITKKSKWPISLDMEIYNDLTVNGYAAVNDFYKLTHPNFNTVREYDLRAFLNIPIEVSGKFWGIIGFIKNQCPYDWSESDIYLGKLIAGIFSGVVSRSIAEQQLLLAKEMAEQANRAKGDFLSRMSHEIRTPMNAIIGMTGIAESSGDPEKMMYCLERIESSSKHLLSLINMILDISKIDADKLELSYDEFNLEGMLKNITETVSFQIEKKKQNLIINIDNDLPPVFVGDEIRLSQVITNLLSNAVKFTPDGGTVTLNIRNIDISGDISTLLVEVADTGIGISKEQQSRLFTPFEQADGGISRKYGGTGLGLTISKRIVELMGGRIWIESELGKGSSFFFTVKLMIGKSDSLPAKKQKVNSQAYNFKNHTLLVAEDIEINREIVSAVLEGTQVAIDFAQDGAQAVSMFKNDAARYSLILMDIQMPEMDGYEAAQRIREIGGEKADTIPIVAMTANVFSEDVEKCIKVGMNDHIGKPVDTDELLIKLDQYLPREQPGTEVCL